MALVSKRNSAVKSMTKSLGYINRLQEGESLRSVRARYDLLQKQWDTFLSHHEAIMDVTGEKELDNQAAEYDVAEDLYMQCIQAFENKIDQLSIPTEPNENDDNDSEADTRNSSSALGRTSVRLPKITLPTFAGGYDEWQSFRDLFTSMVHANQTIGNAEKLHYLKTSLKGEAEGLLANVLVTDANYIESWNVLLRMYDNKRVLVYTLIEKILNMPDASATAASIKATLNTAMRHIRALANLQQPIDSWDSWLIVILMKKLDVESKRRWDEQIASTVEPPKWELFEKYLIERFRTLEGSFLQPVTDEKSSKSIERVKSFLATPSEKCELCHQNHRLYRCEQFLQRPVVAKREFISTNNLCYNCLSPHHTSARCRSRFRCFTCKKRHHTLLHDEHTPNRLDKSAPTSQSVNTPSSAIVTPPSSSIITTSSSSIITTPSTRSTIAPVIASHFAKGSTSYLLATALIQVIDDNGVGHTMRALIDPGSMTSFITMKAVSALGLQKKKSVVSIEGVGCTQTDQTLGVVLLKFSSRFNHQQMHTTQAFVLRSITNSLPTHFIENASWNHLQDLQLADPCYNQPGPIDVLFGADIYPSLIKSGVIMGSPGSPIAQSTSLGYIITGPSTGTTSHIHSFHCQPQIDDQLRKFWEIEEPPIAHTNSADDDACEQHFRNTCRRKTNGTFIVRIPFKQLLHVTLGHSRNSAMMRLHQLERRLSSNDELRRQYIAFMEEYLELNHMELVPVEEISTPPHLSYYMPHHAILKDSTTTRLRVVFDASMKTSGGASLNELMHTGPALQHSLFAIIIRWRKHAIAFTADIEKMYRQILIHPEDSDFQRILWRKTPDEPVRDYRLRTVTYGTSSAPFLAIKTLQTMAEEEKNNFPIASKIALNDMYVDDVCSGCDDVESAMQAQTQLLQMFHSGGFNLRKWASNSADVLQNVPAEHREYQTPVTINSHSTIKALGISWNPSTDQFEFHLRLPSRGGSPTKRTLLADVSTLFDPLGWLAPIIVLAKIMFQKLWLVGISWDDRLPEQIQQEWLAYRNNLHQIDQIKIHRWIGHHSTQSHSELHGFCDASNNAYAAAVYYRVIYSDGSVAVRLLAAKTKVTPIKQISLPRLELCGALLLARTLKMVKEALEMNEIKTHTWTDSEIVLYWLRDQPRNLKTFVANRTSEIQTTLNNNQWHHVPSLENPADCASRGLSPAQLKAHSMWWFGPSWLTQDATKWPCKSLKIPEEGLLERRKDAVVVTATFQKLQLLEEKSSLLELTRIIAYCHRFIENCKRKRSERKFDFLGADELHNALTTCIRNVQMGHFSDEFNSLQLDDQSVLRVGGRLNNSILPRSQKFPILLPNTGHFCRLVLAQAHASTLHGTVQQTMSYLRQRYWIVDARNLVRRYIHSCLVCFRHTVKANQHQLMADLPAQRVIQSRPFSHTGIDYAGPINIKFGKGRVSLPRSRGLQVGVVWYNIYTATMAPTSLAQQLRFHGNINGVVSCRQL